MTPDPTAEPASPPTLPSTAGMTTRVVKGSVWTLIGQVLPMSVALITTPIVIRMLGAEGYGVIVLVILIPGYLTFADLGMGMASTKFGSEAFGRGDLADEARIVRTAALVALTVAVPVAAAMFAVSDRLGVWLNVPADLLPDASLAFKLASVTFVFTLLNNVVNTPELARLRMDLNTLVNAGARIAGLVAVPIVLFFGGGISGAVFALMAASILTFVGHVIASGRLNAQLFDLSIDRRLVRPLLRFGGALAVSAVAAVLLVNLEKLILTKQTSVETLAYYSVAFTLANAATLFSGAMSQSLIPAFAQLMAPQNREQLISLFARAVRISIFALLPLLTILFVIARPFFTLWAGPDFGRESTIPFYILLCGLLFNLSAYIPSSLLLAAGRTDIFAKLYWIELIPYIFLTGVLATFYGAVGAAAAWSLRVIADAFTFFWLARRVSGVAVGLRPYTTSIIFGAVLLVPVIVVVLIYPTPNVWLLGLMLAASVMIYAALMWYTVIDKDEKRWASAWLERMVFWRRVRAS